jgi:hypothetical protein
MRKAHCRGRRQRLRSNRESRSVQKEAPAAFRLTGLVRTERAPAVARATAAARRPTNSGGARVCGGVAQLGERLLCKQEVIGSIPFTSTNLRCAAAEVVLRSAQREGGPVRRRAASVGRPPSTLASSGSGEAVFAGGDEPLAFDL